MQNADVIDARFKVQGACDSEQQKWQKREEKKPGGIQGLETVRNRMSGTETDKRGGTSNGNRANQSRAERRTEGGKRKAGNDDAWFVARRGSIISIGSLHHFVPLVPTGRHGEREVDGRLRSRETMAAGGGVERGTITVAIIKGNRI
ncbi:hypothetical protein ANO11243_044760 [Dothideomycetidae sp. 11243]|nr:hypothetical protein ANO11243_044760 [fungal sp. No.11243]